MNHRHTHPTARRAAELVRNFPFLTTFGTGVLFCTLFLIASTANAQTEHLLYSFSGDPDGAEPTSAPVFDSQGNLYGNTQTGGSGNGTIFTVTPSGTESVLYTFTGGNDGSTPNGGLIIQNDILYGTTSGGGVYGHGTIFEMTLSGTITTLYSFHGGTDGGYPLCTLVMDAQGNLYGTAEEGGIGFGMVFELSPSGTETILHTFNPGTGDGYDPYAGLIFVNGNLYGTTSAGGTAGKGTVFEVTPSGTETVLYSFAGGTDGAAPVASLVLGKDNLLYGTTSAGGSSSQGVVFSITTSGTETVVHTFTSSTGDGAYPYAPMILDSAGNLYGTTEQGGTFNGGSIFEITTAGVESIVHSFDPNSGDGDLPACAVTLYQGNLYGTTVHGGAHNDGAVFEQTVATAPAITSANATTFTVGTAGSFTATTTGSPTPSLSEAGTLPGVVNFTDNGNGTATLAGTPAGGTGGTYALTLTAHNGIGTNATQAFTLTIDQAPAITAPGAATFYVGAPGSLTISATGFPTPTLSESGTLPTGVSFNPTTGGLTGTPAAGTLGTYTLIFTATNGVGSSAAATTILTVAPGETAPVITSTNNATFIYGLPAGNGTTLPYNYFLITTTGSPAPSMTAKTSAGVKVPFFKDLRNGTAQLSESPGSDGGETFTITATGAGLTATQAFTLNVVDLPTAPTFSSAADTGFTVGVFNTFTVAAGPYVTKIVAKMSVPGIGFTDNHDGTATISGTPTATGTYAITFTASNPNAYDPVTKTPRPYTLTQKFTLGVLPSGQTGPAITSANNTTFVYGLPAGNGTALLPYNYFLITSTGSPTPTLTAKTKAGGQVPFFTPLANGMAQLSETPGLGGETLILTATGADALTATQTFSLNVVRLPIAPTFSSAPEAGFTVGVFNNFTVAAGPYVDKFVAKMSVPGVKFTDNQDGTATISGTPTTTGSYPITLTAENPDAYDPATKKSRVYAKTQTFTLGVLPAGQSAPAITSANTATFVYGLPAGAGKTESYNYFLITTTGSPAPTLTAKNAKGATIPFFKSLGNGTAQLSEAPASLGAETFTITATGAGGLAATQTFTLNVVALPTAPVFSSADDVGFTVGVFSSFNVAAGPYVDKFVAKMSVPGVTLIDNHDGTATLSGTPTVTGDYSISFTASNPNAYDPATKKAVPYVATQQFTLGVLP